VNEKIEVVLRELQSRPKKKNKLSQSNIRGGNETKNTIQAKSSAEIKKHINSIQEEAAKNTVISLGSDVRTKQAMVFAYKLKRQNGEMKWRTVARIAVAKFYPELTQNPRALKIDSIRVNLHHKFPPRRS
jgi:hypothetical protein